MIRVAVLVYLSLFFLSCGYKPTAIYSKDILGDRIFADVKISLKDPENSIIIKDALNEAIVTKFHSQISPKEQATSKLFVELESVDFRPIEYDKNGYVVTYKSVVTLKTRYIDKDAHETLLISSGDYDFNIESLSVISDTLRFNAIKEASLKAIDALISKISIRGIK